MRRAFVLGAILGFAAVLLAGCNEDPCNHEGDVKASGGQIYTCADRHNGNGLRWYK